MTSDDVDQRVTASSTARGGAQLRDRVTDAIATAVVDELAENGYGAFSMNSVAARAGVGKAALYRRWPCKEPMVVQVVAELASGGPIPPDTGTLADDLLALLTELRDVVAMPRVAVIATDLLAESLRTPSLADSLRAVVSAPRRAASRQVLERAVHRGEVAADVDLEVVLDLLGGGNLIRYATTGVPFDDAAVRSLHRILLDALTTGRRP